MWRNCDSTTIYNNNKIQSLKIVIIDAIVHYISVTSGELYLSPPLPIPELHQWEGGNIIHARAESGGGRQSELPLSDQPSPRSQQ